MIKKRRFLVDVGQIRMTKRHYLKKNHLINSYIFIANFHKYNSELWGVIIKILYDKYQEIDKNITKSDEQIKVMSELEIEILSKVMELIESLASVCKALTDDETKMEEVFVNFFTSDLKNFYNGVLKKDNSFYYKLFTYPDVFNLKLTEKEKIFLRRVYYVNIQFIKKAFRIINKFYFKNLTVYNKHRHSRPLMIGIPFNYKGCYATSAISFRKNGKILKTQLLHSPTILDKYIGLAKMIIQLQKDLLWNRIHSYECRGYKQPIHQVYFQASKEAHKIIDEINNKVKPKSVIRDNITATLKFNSKIKKIDETLAFYSTEFQATKISNDGYVEKYTSKIKPSN